LRLLLVEFRQCFQGVVQGNHLDLRDVWEIDGNIEFDTLLGSALGCPVLSRVIDQHLPHQPGGDRQEVRAVVGFERSLVNQPEIRFVDQSGALQCMTGTFTPQLASRDVAQLLINKRDQALEGFLVSRPPTNE